MDCSTPGFPLLHYLLESAQTHVHWTDDVIQPSHPLLPNFSPALNLSQHQSLFQWVGSSHQVAKITGASASASVPPMNIQCWFPLQLTSLISLQSKGLSRVFFITTIQKPSVLWCSAFFMIQLSHPYMTTRKIIFLTIRTFVGKVMPLLFFFLMRPY